MTNSRIRSVLAVAVLLLLASTLDAQPVFNPVPLHPSIIDNPAPGNLYLTPMGAGSFCEILNDSGAILYSISSQVPMIDFTKQPNGQFSYFCPDSNGFVVMDSKFKYVTTVRSKNGYYIDVHEFLILANGHYLLMAYDTVHNYDISNLVGMPGTASIVGVVIQELDQNQNVAFQWRGFDEGNFLPEDMQHPETISNGVVDATHSNSLDVDSVGNIFLSSRHFSEITKIDRQTGHIIWRFGGKNNQFTIIGDTLAFSYQHSARLLPNGHLLLFDNGNYHTPHFSRAVEYAIDEQAHTATLVWQFDHNKTVFGGAMGSVQRLPNGNTLIGWGAIVMPGPAVTEVTPSGKIAYEAALDMGFVSYRAFRFETTTADVARMLHADFLVTPVAPNPSAGSASFTVNAPELRTITITVFDESGRTVQTVCQAKPVVGDVRFGFDASSWPKGAYRVVIQSETGSIVQNFVR